MILESNLDSGSSGSLASAVIWADVGEARNLIEELRVYGFRVYGHCVSGSVPGILRVLEALLRRIYFWIYRVLLWGDSLQVSSKYVCIGSQKCRWR